MGEVLDQPLPHALIRSIDTTEARKVPGVHAVLTGAEIGPRRFGKILYDQPVLTYERVRGGVTSAGSVDR